jgi:hypothetical protein
MKETLMEERFVLVVSQVRARKMSGFECDSCPRWWNIECIDEDEFDGKDANDLSGVEFSVKYVPEKYKY